MQIKNKFVYLHSIFDDIHTWLVPLQRWGLFSQKQLIIYKYMKKEIRKDLYTQSEYAKLIGCTQPRVNQMMKEGKLDTLHVNGTVLIKVSKIDLYR